MAYSLYNLLFIIAAVLIIIYSILEGRVRVMHALFLFLIFIIAIILTNSQLKIKGKKINNLTRLLNQSNKEIDRLKEELGKSKKLMEDLRDKIKKL